MTAEELRRDLRTQEADGGGTDVRLVLLEAAMVAGRMDVLDGWLQGLAGMKPNNRRDNRKGLQLALRPLDHPVFPQLAAAWHGLDLQEVTMRLREVDELIELLLTR